MPDPKVYKAAELASARFPMKPLNGTRKAAQSYVDRVTRSTWWSDHCPGFAVATDPPPNRVWVWEGGRFDGGIMDSSVMTLIHGREVPTIILGKGIVNGETLPAIQDRWVILHELAHVMTNAVTGEGHHGRQFCYAYVDLVGRFLGEPQAHALAQAYGDLKIRLDYRLLSVGGRVRLSLPT